MASRFSGTRPILATTLSLCCIVGAPAQTARADRPGQWAYTTPLCDPTEVQKLPDIVYGTKLNLAGERVTLHVDLFLPPGVSSPTDGVSQRRPLIVVMHGGGFFGGNRDKHHDWAVEYATYGYVAACISYRLTPRELRDANPAGFIAAATHATEDGMDAIRFLKMNAETYGIDASRVATIGMSAGGWISVINAIEYDTFNGVQVACKATSSRVQAAIATGVSLADDATCRQMRDTLLKFDAEDSPVLLFHAEERDRVTTASWNDAEVLAGRIRDSGNVCELHPQPGDAHVRDMSPGGPHWTHIAPFLTKHLNLGP